MRHYGVPAQHYRDRDPCYGTIDHYVMVYSWTQVCWCNKVLLQLDVCTSVVLSWPKKVLATATWLCGCQNHEAHEGVHDTVADSPHIPRDNHLWHAWSRVWLLDQTAEAVSRKRLRPVTAEQLKLSRVWDKFQFKTMVKAVHGRWNHIYSRFIQ